MFQSKVELGSQKASNVQIDVAWEILIPNLVTNWIYGLLVIDHQPIGFFCGE
jgi:hypothetical protein